MGNEKAGIIEESEKNQDNQEDQQMGVKEERIRKVAISYYSRSDIRKAIFEFSKNRECVPRYFEGFGKRPDSFQFDSDILELAKRGATSFHGSEEIWSEPLEIATGMSEAELNKLRTGWDLLIDIDCKYLEYSKKAAYSIIMALRSCGVNNMGLKFSGGKGFHIIVPWKAFPEEVSGKKTSDMFPIWPRQICALLKEKSRPFLEKEMANEDSKFLSKFKRGVRCEKCKNISEEREKVLYQCPSCKTELENTLDSFKRKRIIRCPKCETAMIDKHRSTIFFCNLCNKDSEKNPENFNEAIVMEDIFEVLGLDVILVSPRHLFRMPYSLHEKTALASAVLDPDKIKDFDMIKDADPLRITPKNFLPEAKPGEAKRLLIEAIEYKIPSQDNNLISSINKNENKDKKYADVEIKNLNPSMYPPSINKILEGMKTDGRKRALFILLSFFRSLKMPDEKIILEIENWNKKNANPLPPSYLKGQIIWYSRQKQNKLPPNFDKAYYKEIGINPTQEELAAKNPVSYTIKKSFAGFSNYSKNKNTNKSYTKK
jgi:DNA-directed RNA polymerase subunit RPC12/RpoP